MLAPTPLTTEKTISTRQQSYESLTDHLAKYIELLSQEPLYIPNETELTMPGLEVKLSAMKTANADTIDSYTTWSNACIQQNQTPVQPTHRISTDSIRHKKIYKIPIRSHKPTVQTNFGPPVQIHQRTISTPKHKVGNLTSKVANFIIKIHN